MSDLSRADLGANATEVTEDPKRPLEVWIVVVLGLLQGLGALAAAGILLYARSDPELLELIAEEDPGLSDTALLALGLTVGVVGLVNTVFAILLAAGSNFVRAIYAAIATLEIATATYGLVAVRDLRAAAVVALLYPVATVWLLYGSKRSVRFFES